MQESSMKRTVEALLIATDEPLAIEKIMEITGLSKDDINLFIQELNQEYHNSNRSFEIKEVAGGFQIYTLPEFALWVGALHDRKSKLTKAALETMAIIAYHQPITRAEIEKVRGVDSTWILDSLLQKGLIKTCGRLSVPGRPIRYGTTKEFLRYFGIKDLNELPREEDFGEEATVLIQQESESEQEATISQNDDTTEHTDNRNDTDDLDNDPSVI
jgi:segregation and condensation protein B